MPPPFLRALLLLLLTLAACRPSDRAPYTPSDAPAAAAPAAAQAAAAEELVFGVRIIRDPERAMEVYQPLLDHLGRELGGIRLRLESYRTDEDYEAGLARGGLHLAILGPYLAIGATDRGYRIVARLGSEDSTKNLILVRRDSGLRTLAQLKGRSLSVSEATRFSGSILTLWSLHEQGFDLRRDLKRVPVASNEASIWGMYLRETDAASTILSVWRRFIREHPRWADELEVLWETGSFPPPALIAHRSLGEARQARIRAVLRALPASLEGRALLARLRIDAFQPAGRETYEPVLALVKRYEAVYGRAK